MLVNIILIGFMGSGKSSVGRRLAEQTGRTLIDTDNKIKTEQGMEIPEIFNKFGEPHFRILETDALKQLQGCENAIIATGGGMVEQPENLELLRQIGHLFYLEVEWAVLKKRIGAGRGRPLGGDGENWAPVKSLFDRREPIYLKADSVIRTKGKSLNMITREIIEVMSES